MKRSFQLFALTSVCLLAGFALNGCGLLGDKGVPKEQINADIADKTIEVKKADDLETQTEWNFKDDSYRCFAPKEKTTFGESDAYMFINLSSIRLTKGEDTHVLFGEILLHYKKDNGKWKLEKIGPQDVRTNALTGDAFSKFLDLQMPLCNYFKYTTPIK